METPTIVFLIYLPIAGPIIWWLMWREDCDGMRSAWRYYRERKTRDRLSPHQFYERFYKSSGVKEGLVLRLLSLHAELWGVDEKLIRPHDNYSRICASLTGMETIDKIRSVFGVSVPDEDLEKIDGSFDSFVKYLDLRSKDAAGSPEGVASGSRRGGRVGVLDGPEL